MWSNQSEEQVQKQQLSVSNTSIKLMNTKHETLEKRDVFRASLHELKLMASIERSDSLSTWMVASI